jgi:hypothetical protein
LNVSDQDKFPTCVRSVNACSDDLMMNLQIHQSGQLDIPTCSVPIDPQDTAAQGFVAQHGGVDAVKKDELLVTEFGEKLDLKPDGDVMEQENQVRLERMLKDIVGTSIVRWRITAHSTTAITRMAHSSVAR